MRPTLKQILITSTLLFQACPVVAADAASAKTDMGQLDDQGGNAQSPTVILGQPVIERSCDVGASSIEECQAIISMDKRHISILERKKRDFPSLPPREFIARRRNFEERLARDEAALILIERSVKSGASFRPHRRQGWLFPQNGNHGDVAPTIAEMVDNWARPQASASVVSQGIEGIYSVSGTLTVPNVTVPGTGVCDGVHNVTYLTSWWLGIGGTDDDNLIFQSGVLDKIVCSAGSTVTMPTYIGSEQNLAVQKTEVDIPKLNGTIKAGDIVIIQVGSASVARVKPGDCSGRGSGCPA